MSKKLSRTEESGAPNRDHSEDADPPRVLISLRTSSPQKRSAASRRSQKEPTSEEYSVLIGHSPIGEFLSMATVQAVDAHRVDQRGLVNDWLSANDRISAFHDWTPGFADSSTIGTVADDLKDLVLEVEADRIFQRCFNFVPASVGVVELDRLIPLQKLVNLDHVRRLTRKVGAGPSPRSIFRICLPADHPQPRFQQTRLGQNSWVFVSRSNDLRFLDALLLRPDQLFGYMAPGPVAGIVGLVVGFSSNFVNVIQIGKRVFLANGTNRAYALRRLGITHVPAVVQSVNRLDELSLVLAPPLLQAVPHLLQSVRPPVLKDFFDPLLTKTVKLPPFNYQVRVKFEVEGPLGFPYCISG